MSKVNNELREICIEFIHGKLREISENCYAAGWMSGIEFTVWDAVQGGTSSIVNEQEAKLLKEASNVIGGWVAWNDHIGDAVFVPHSEWNRMCQQEERNYED
jgi:hypothetical protein